jgi:hypothetical protein
MRELREVLIEDRADHACEIWIHAYNNRRARSICPRVKKNAGTHQASLTEGR